MGGASGSYCRFRPAGVMQSSFHPITAQLPSREPPFTCARHPGLSSCFILVLTVTSPLFPLQGFGVSAQGIVVYRGAYFGLYDSTKGTLITKARLPPVARFHPSPAVPRPI